MKRWRQAIADSVIPGVVAGMAITLTAAWRGRTDSGSAAAPINAATRVFRGDRAAAVARATLRHTVPGVLINMAAATFWAAVMQKLFGAAIDRRAAPAALLGAAATAGMAYVTDYKLVPERVTPGYEKRVSRRSLLVIFGAFAAGLAAGAHLGRRRPD